MQNGDSILLDEVFNQLALNVLKRAFPHLAIFDNFNVYIGNDSTSTPTSLVVTELAKNYYDKYHIYFDNYFTSVELMELLLRNHTYAGVNAHFVYG